MAAEFELWTDGGINKKIGVASWGYCIKPVESCEHVIYDKGYFSEEPTSQRAELTAAIKGLERVIELLPPMMYKSQVDLTVVSDSRYLVDGMNEWRYTWRLKSWKRYDNKPVKNKDLWVKLDTLSKSFNNLKFKWVKGHSGVEWNEFVDGLCGLALKEAIRNHDSEGNKADISV